ncbi:MAG: hypothetical protein NT007_00125 [Candidatus Kapabacteria bacterium]|nr:hypothetical protein [Candidatus Kapabacteria bacterium]
MASKVDLCLQSEVLTDLQDGGYLISYVSVIPACAQMTAFK